jgi:hypothetical protein
MSGRKMKRDSSQNEYLVRRMGILPRHISVLAPPIPPWGTPFAAGGDTPLHHSSLIHLFLNPSTHFCEESERKL